MKNTLKSGFTLSEVLITIAIIGVVAALTLPTVMSSSTYKSLGVKIAKFASTTENASRAYVNANDAFKIDKDDEENEYKSILNFVNDTFLIEAVGNDNTIGDLSEIKFNSTPQGIKGTNYITLKDGTLIDIDTVTETLSKKYNTKKYGNPVFTIAFDPMVKGLPSSIQKVYRFTVTELGYVLPSSGDSCLQSIYSRQFSTSQQDFVDGDLKDVCAAKDSWSNNTDN